MENQVRVAVRNGFLATGIATITVTVTPGTDPTMVVTSVDEYDGCNVLHQITHSTHHQSNYKFTVNLYLYFNVANFIDFI